MQLKTNMPIALLIEPWQHNHNSTYTATAKKCLMGAVRQEGLPGNPSNGKRMK